MESEVMKVFEDYLDRVTAADIEDNDINDVDVADDDTTEVEPS